MPEAKMSMERRENPRFAMKIPVKYCLEKDKEVIKVITEWRKEAKNAYTLDMSLGGMKIVVDQPLSMGDLLKFELYLLDKVNVVTIFAEVMWSGPDCAGIRFLMIKPEELDALKVFLEKSSKA